MGKIFVPSSTIYFITYADQGNTTEMPQCDNKSRKRKGTGKREKENWRGPLKGWD